MKRMFKLVGRCLRFGEPLLLVGETGTGKTTVCQVYAELLGQHLSILNCHQHTETADFIGGLRPIRNKERTSENLNAHIVKFFEEYAKTELIQVHPAPATKSLGDSLRFIESAVTFITDYLREKISTLGAHVDIYLRLLSLADEIKSENAEFLSLFKWYDGPLVNAMKTGDIFLIDEISLADDAVLERLNSVLEPGRSLVISEKGGIKVEEVTAQSDFRILATMNPGGDFGKKELSPALRNRFTEIWIPQIDEREDFIQIIDGYLNQNIRNLEISGKILDFCEFFGENSSAKFVMSLRDILSWVNFINQTENKLGVWNAYVHAACLILLDGIGMTQVLGSGKNLREISVKFLLDQIPDSSRHEVAEFLQFEDSENSKPNSEMPKPRIEGDRYKLGPFSVPVGTVAYRDPESFTMEAPTTSVNLLKLLRGLQIHKPILMEGSPGVGKTTLVRMLLFTGSHYPF